MFVFGSGKKRIPKIANSLRLRAAAGSYLSKTFGAASNNQKWTYSVWVKRGTLGTNQELLSSGTSTSNFDAFYFNTSNNLCFLEVVAGVTRTSLITTQVFRDPAAWYHIVLAYDSTQAVVANRISLYVNGVKVTSFSTATYPALNNGSYINWTSIQTIGKFAPSATEYVDGYLARICFVDGQALTPSSFGYIENSISQWVSKSQSACKSVVDAGGANSFMLDFDNGTSLTTLGYDKSSKANNWTLTGASLTNGPAYDWMTDTPTNNYATLNPLENFGTETGATTEGALRVTSGGTSNGLGQSRATTIATSGIDLYAEFTILATSGSTTYSGISVVRRSWLNYVSLSFAGSSISAQISTEAGVQQSGLGFVTVNDVISISVSANGSVTFKKNNAAIGVPQQLNGSGDIVFYVTAATGGAGANIGSIACNFGQRAFAYTPPTGYKALCTANLPLPVIKSPKKHFDVVTWTGANSTVARTISGGQFQPDLVWGKSRSPDAFSHQFYDSVRGTGKALSSDITGAEITNSASGYLSAFNTDGFATTQGSSDNWYWNKLNTNYVSWLWKAGGAAVTNTDGTITSQVSANTAAGFSIITYTSDTSGTPKTVGHGLGVAPSMIIVKSRSTGQNWPVYHNSLTSASYYVMLNSTAAQASLAAIWNSTAPSSTVFSIGGSPMVNSDLGANYVAYCFAEVPGFSKIGSYTGNGSADGPFVYCGFRPRYVMTKRTDATSDWVIHDTARDANNPAVLELYADLSNAEANASRACDFLSNGFKLRDTNAMWNASGGTYIFIAFAESPFKYANAR